MFDGGGDHEQVLKTFWRRIGAIACTLFVLLISFVGSQWVKSDAQIRVSKETTYILGPLGANGLPDYTAEKRQREGWDIPSEENAAREFWMAMGQDLHSQNHWNVLAGFLKFDPAKHRNGLLQLEDKLVEDLFPWIAKTSKSLSAFEVADLVREVPWQSKECPPADEFLKAIDARLDLLAASTTGGKKFYSPSEEALELVDEVDIGFIKGQAIRKAQEMLCVRAASRIGQAELDIAWQDLLAALRLVDLFEENFVGYLLFSAIREYPRRLLGTILAHPKLSDELLTTIRKDLKTLTDSGQMVSQCIQAERMVSISTIATSRRKLLEVHTTNSEIEPLHGGSTDWNVVLRHYNQAFDLMQAAIDASSVTNRHQLIASLSAMKSKQAAEVENRWTRARAIWDGGQRSELIAYDWLSTSLSSFEMVAERHSDTVCRDRMIEIQIKLAELRLATGAYPRSLDGLKGLPSDPYSGLTFQYRPVKSGYLLYSVGPNGMDDAGSGVGSIFRGKHALDVLELGDPVKVEAFLRDMDATDAIRQDRFYDDLVPWDADDISKRIVFPNKSFTAILKDGF